MKKYNKDLHERLRHRTGLYCYNDNIGVDSDDIDALLDELERLQFESGWIPVSENPKTTDVYYTYCKANGHKWSEENNYIVGVGWSNKFVAHWRPLPQPPESDMSDTQNEERE